MTGRGWTAFLALGASLSGCAWGPRPARPIDVSAGVIAARVVFKGQSLPNFLRHPAQEVYYARVLPSGDLDLDHPLRSNYHRGGYVYWLNAPAGRYAPIAAAYSVLGLRYLARLDKEVRRDMVVDLRPGAFAFAGDTLVRTDWTGMGDALLHLARHIQGCLPLLGRPTVDIDGASHLTDRSAEAEGRVLRRAAAALGARGWDDAVRARYDELGPPPPTLYSGWGWRRRPMPRLRTDRFSYIDTLGWKPGRGLGAAWYWRQPRDRAQIAVIFFSTADAGFRPASDYLDAMRAAGSGGDDHMLFDLTVSSRAAMAVRYTSRLYPKQDLPGGRARVIKTETILVPDPEGYYVVRLRAPAAYFSRYLPAFARFVRYLVLEKRPSPEAKS